MVIDLGELRADAEPRPWRHPVDARRRILLAVVALLALAALAGSRPTAPGLSVPLWSGPARSISWGTGSIFAVDPAGRGVSSYEPASGRRRWHLDTARPVGWIDDLGAGRVLVMTALDATDGGDGDIAATLVDDGTGRAIATVAGSPWDLVPGGPVLLIRGTPGCGRPLCQTLVRIDRATGQVRWSLPVDGDQVLAAMPEQGDGFAIVAGDRVEIRSADTMAVTHRLQLPPDAGGRVAALYRDRLVTAQRRPDGISVTAYPLTGAPPAWITMIPRTEPGEPRDDWLNLGGCGQFLCVYVGVWTTIVDPDTGAVRDQWPVGVAAGPVNGLVIALTSAPNGSGSNSLVLALSSVSGDVRQRVPGAAIVSWRAAEGQAMLAQEGLYDTGFLRVDRLGQLIALGSVPGRNLDCQARADLLACVTNTGRLTVWRLPSF